MREGGDSARGKERVKKRDGVREREHEGEKERCHYTE